MNQGKLYEDPRIIKEIKSKKDLSDEKFKLIFGDYGDVQDEEETELKLSGDLFRLRDAVNEYEDEEDDQSGMLTTRQHDMDKLMFTQLNFDDDEDLSAEPFQENLSNFYSSNGKGLKKLES